MMPRIQIVASSHCALLRVSQLSIYLVALLALIETEVVWCRWLVGCQLIFPSKAGALVLSQSAQ
eukprot:7967975-Karenia_brevis.AAC.1